MKFDQLSYFLEAAKQQHIGKAAKALHISPSAVSHSISHLEEELGRELFSKRGKNIVLTEAGLQLKEKAERLVKEIQMLQEEMSSDSAEISGNYRTGASHDLCGSFLAPAVAKLQKSNPKLTSEVFTLRSSQVVAGVTSGELDLGLCFNPVDHPNLDFEIISTGLLGICFSLTHPIWKIKESDRISRLNEFPAILPKSFQGVEVCESHAAFKKCNIKPQVLSYVDSYAVAIKMVSETNGWGFIPEWIIEREKSSVKGLKLPKDWSAKCEIAIVMGKDRFVSLGLKRLIQILKEEVTG